MGEFSLNEGETKVKKGWRFFAVVKDIISKVAYTLSIPFQNLRHPVIKPDSHYNINNLPREKPRPYTSR